MDARDIATTNASINALSAMRNNHPCWNPDRERLEFDESWFAMMIPAMGGDNEDEWIAWAMGYARDIDRRFEDDDLLGEQGTSLAYAALWFMDKRIEAGDTFQYIVEMNANFKKWGSLSGPQVRGILNTLRAQALRDDRQEQDLVFRENLPNVIAMFDSARAAGLKKPRIRFLVDNVTVVIYPAGETSKNAGSYYVKEQVPFGVEGQYYGKVSATGEIDTRLEASGVVATLRSLDSNAEETLRAYGQKTNKCGICGLTLTNKASKERGIGPICADKFGI